MSVTRNVLRGVLRSVTGSVIRAGVISRYFTPLDSSASQHFGIPQILSGTEITMFVYPTNGNVGLPLGAPAVTNNIFQIITFTLTANMDFIGRENTNYFDGFIADVVGGGRIYAINENFGTTSVLIDTGGTGQNGTAQNISTESPLFTKQPDGDWLGAEKVANGGFDTSIIGWQITGTPDATHDFVWDNGTGLYTCGAISPSVGFRQTSLTEVGLVYRVTLDNKVTSGTMKMTGPIPTDLIDGYNEYSGAAIGTTLEFTRAVANTESNFDNISLKQLLEVAT